MDRSTKERLTGAIVLVAVAWLVIPVFLDGPEEETGAVRQNVDLPGQEGQPTRTRRIVLDPRSETVRGDEAGEKITDPPPATRRLPAPASGSGTAAEETAAAGEAASPADAAAESDATGAARQEAPDPASQAAGESQPEPQPEPQPEAQAEPEPEPEPKSAAAPAEQPSPAAESLWAVQLGSFSNEENAEGLAADLRDQGFAAFLSRVQSGGRTLHRVRVGPQGSRDEAEKVAAALAKAGQKGQVVSHP